MKVNIPLGPVDVVILVIIGIMMIGGVKIVRGFFHEGEHNLKSSTYNGKGAVKITIAIGGMQCGHCEANINDTLRNNFDISKVSSNHTKGEATIICKHDIDESKIQQAIEESGYQFIGVEKENYKRKIA
jgi:copper chaperone CopZ